MPAFNSTSNRKQKKDCRGSTLQGNLDVVAKFAIKKYPFTL